MIFATILLGLIFVIIYGTCSIMSKLSKEPKKINKKSTGITYLDELNEAARRGIIGGGPPNDVKRD